MEHEWETFHYEGNWFTKETFYKLRMGLCSILTGITNFWVFFMGLETVFTLFHHEWWKRVMEKGFSFFHHSFLSLFSITLFHHSFPSLVMEKSENCFQTHEEKREKHWVIPFGIEQSWFLVMRWYWDTLWIILSAFQLLYWPFSYFWYVNSTLWSQAIFWRWVQPPLFTSI